MIARLLALLWLACAVLALPTLATSAAAQNANPFTGAPAPRETAPERAMPHDVAAPGLLTRLGREIVQLQRRMNLALAGQMRTIRDGGRDGRPGAGLLIGIALAFLYGAIHVAGPGHGKVVIVSYFLGRDAKLTRGLWLGLQIAATHVVAAIVLVWLADVALRQAFGGTPAELRTVQAVSYGAILAVGLHLVWQAVQRLRGQFVAACGHDHGHHAHHHHAADSRQERARQGILSFAVGLVPCTGATLVMLYALANDILYAGIVMVLAIGGGMAMAMAAIGVATILARRTALLRLKAGADVGGRLGGVLQLAAGLVIGGLGAVMLYAALQGGAPAI